MLMSVETMNQSTAKDLAGGYLLWMLSQDKKIGEQPTFDQELSKKIVQPLEEEAEVSGPRKPVKARKMATPLHKRTLTLDLTASAPAPSHCATLHEIHNLAGDPTTRSSLREAFAEPVTLPPTTSLLDDSTSPGLPPPRVCSPGPSVDLHNQEDLFLLPTPTSDKITLPDWFRFSKTTVVIGKGHLPKTTPGNVLLRQMVRDRLNDYQETNRRGRAVLVSEVYQEFQRLNPDGRCFGNFDDSSSTTSPQWCEAKEHSARDKIAASFRDCLSHLYKSSTQSKVAKRRIRKAEKSASRRTSSRK